MAKKVSQSRRSELIKADKKVFDTNSKSSLVRKQINKAHFLEVAF